MASLDNSLGMRTRTHPMIAFIGVSIGNFLVLLDTSILNVALPQIQREFDAPSVLVPWTAVAYTIVFAGLLLAAGAVSDRFGSLRVYRGSLIAFAAISLACALAPTIETLIAFRALLGVAAASMVPASIALLAQLYPNSKDRSRAIGTWAAITSSGLLLGPVLGGILVTLGSWRLIFVVNPLVILFALGMIVRMTNVRPDKVRPLDRWGIALSIIVLGSASWGFIDAGTNGWGRPDSSLALAVAAIALVLLVWVERRVAHPVLPPGLFANPEVSVAGLAAAMATLVFYGILFTLTLWYQRDRGLSPLMTGLAFVPMTLPMCVLPIVTGRMVAAIGARKLILFGLFFDVLAGLMLIGVGDSGSWLLWVVLAELALVLASTTVIPAGTAQVAVSAPAEYAASAQGALNAGRQAGSALGVAILGPLTSMHTVGWVLASLSFVTILLALLKRPA